jgi:hypothetical protein
LRTKLVRMIATTIGEVKINRGDRRLQAFAAKHRRSYDD